MVTAIFRLHLNFLNGPVLAYLFPEIESRHVSLVHVIKLNESRDSFLNLFSIIPDIAGQGDVLFATWIDAGDSVLSVESRR